jgi:hypothetical protein
LHIGHAVAAVVKTRVRRVTRIGVIRVAVR